MSYALGLASILCWMFAEIPQIKTNYQTKSASSLHFYFLTAWLVGDILNLLGCFLEPNTLSTQLYMAVVYTIATLILIGQKVYYDYLYPRWRGAKKEASLNCPVTDIKEKLTMSKCEHGGVGTKLNQCGVPIPVKPPSLYYMSARSFSMSPTSISGSFFSHPHNFCQIYEDDASQGLSKEPLLEKHVCSPSESHTKTKDLLCLASSSFFFLGSIGLHIINGTNLPSNGAVMLAGRKLLHVRYNGASSVHDIGGRNSVGNYLGWGMAAAYISGRLPQILLNGVNPYMFILALSGNGTYIASILIRSLEWSKIGPNLPWLVDAGLCVLLDVCILIQLCALPKIRGRKK